MRSLLLRLVLFLAFALPAAHAQSYLQGFPSLVGNNADGEAAVATGLLPVEGYQMVWNGTTWDRAPKIQTGSGNVTATTQRVTIASDQIIKVAGTTTDIIVTPVVTTSGYASGNCIGGASAGGSAILSLANAVRGSGVQSGTIQSLTINCKIVNTAQIDVLFFGASPSGTATDKVAVAIASNTLGIISVSNWISMGTYSTGMQTGQPLSFVLPSGTTLYAVMVIRGALTPNSSSDITLSARIIQD